MSEGEPIDYPPRRNLKLVVAYHGAAYHGWQRQRPEFDTVQQQLEAAVQSVLKHPVTVFGAGRTDAGVHAEGQVANLYTTRLTIPLAGLRRAINARLPGDVAVRSIREVPAHFHASRSAVGKTYRYRIWTCPSRPVGLHGRVYHYWRELDADVMRAAGKRFVGRNDFRGLATSSDERQDTVRTIFRCDVARVGDGELHVTVQGDGFLYNMVRNLVGTLVEIGRGRWDVEQVDRILATADRRHAGPTAPAAGLTLLCVHYPPGL